MNSKNFTPNYSSLKNVRLEEGFFYHWYEKINTITAKDVFEKFISEGALINYERISQGKTGEHVGFPWYHGLLCECIRGISDLNTTSKNDWLNEKIDHVVDLFEKAQNAVGDGFLNPFTTLMRPNQRFGKNGGNCNWQHELFNTGCMVEAGVHNYFATGKTKLLGIAVKALNYYANFIGEPPKRNVVPEHSLPEKAFLKAYELFISDKDLTKKLGAKPSEYIRLVRFFIEHKGDNLTRYSEPKFLREYAQDHRPARKQFEAVGHAVRAVNFYEGMTALSIIDRDEELLNVCKIIYEDIANTKLHINGGVGVYKTEEKFGTQYELPTEAYLETCAGVGLIFFCMELFKATKEARIWDTIETTLYNLIPASVSEEGNKYTYENPIESNNDRERWAWHPCPCCPPMLLKLAGLLPTMPFAENGNKLWLNLFIDCTINKEQGEITFKNNNLFFNLKDKTEFTLNIRIPYWTRNFSVKLNGETLPFEMEKGYAVINRVFNKGDVITLIYDTPIVKYASHPYVEATYSKVAIKKGPVLYCAESFDNGNNKEGVEVTLKEEQTPKITSDNEIILTTTNNKQLKLIPYYSWNNRGACFMRVWFKEENFTNDKTNGLYIPYKEY